MAAQVVTEKFQAKVGAHIEGEIDNATPTGKHFVDKQPPLGFFNQAAFDNSGKYEANAPLDGPVLSGGDDYAKAEAKSTIDLSDDLTLVGRYDGKLQGDIKTAGYTARSKSNGVIYGRKQYNIADVEESTKRYKWRWALLLNATISDDLINQSNSRCKLHGMLDEYNDVEMEWNHPTHDWRISGSKRLADGTVQPIVPYHVAPGTQLTVEFFRWTTGPETYWPQIDFNWEDEHWGPGQEDGLLWEQNFGHVAETTNPPYDETHMADLRLILVQAVEV